jgi:hypothetical protein
MSNYRIVSLLFAVVLGIAILLAFVTTIERVNTRTADNRTPPVTTSLAKPHAR